jgi:vacuolar-type H+-ATPase subunit E/Vma4
MALTDLLTALEAEAMREHREAEARAEAEATRLTAEADREASRIREQVLAAALAGARSDAGIRLAQARAEGRGRVRRARQEAVDLLRDELRQQVGGLRDRPDHDRVTGALLDRALALVPAAAVRADRRDEALVGRLLAERGLQGPVRPDLVTQAGVEVDAGDGRSVLATVEELLDDADDLLARAVDAATGPATGTTGTTEEGSG